MNKLLKRLFVFSLIFYLGSTIYTRFVDSAYSDSFSKLIFALAPEFMEGRDSVDTQICTLSTSEVAQLLKTNPDYCPESSEECSSKEYVVIRLKNEDITVFGAIKCYFSCFPFPLVSDLLLPGKMDVYSNLIYPFPALTKDEAVKKCDISLRWKNIGG